MDPGLMGMPDHNNGMGKMDMKMEMKMAFYWGRRMELIFLGWSAHTVVQYVLSLAALFALALFHKALTHVRTLIFDPDHGRFNNMIWAQKNWGLVLLKRRLLHLMPRLVTFSCWL